jgi:hypothetical protein
VLIIGSNPNGYSLGVGQVVYDPLIPDGFIYEKELLCSNGNPISPASFFSLLNNTFFNDHIRWYKPNVNSTLVKGFFVGCNPLEGLLQSTLDCLYDIQCLQLLTEYFPNLKPVCIRVYYLFLLIYSFFI